MSAHRVCSLHAHCGVSVRVCVRDCCLSTGETNLIAQRRGGYCFEQNTQRFAFKGVSNQEP